MADTGTRIHFPDQNRISGEKKSNNVVIRGEISNLENARQRIRVSHLCQLCVCKSYYKPNVAHFAKADIPVEVILDCCRIESVNSLGESSLTDYFTKTFGVALRFYPKIDGVNCQINIHGQQDRIELLKQAVAYLGQVTQTSVVS